MPIYDYRCSECGRQVEVMHAIGESGPAACQECGGAMRKTLSTPAIHFKGSGWAKKDARADGKPKSGSAGKGTAGEAASGGTESGSSGASEKSASDPGSATPKPTSAGATPD